MNVRSRSRWLARRRARGIALGVVLGNLGAVTIQQSAAAYPQDPNNCNDSSLTWNISDNSDPLWTDGGVDRRVWVNAAIYTLDDARDDGTRLVSIGAGGGVDVSIRTDPEGSYGSSECDWPNATMWVNYWYTRDDPQAKFFYKVARHEMFHLAGAEHGGNDDSWNSDDPPTMATCIDWTTFRSTNSLSQDDAAYETWLHGGLAYRQLHANIGFEEGTDWWRTNDGQLTYKSSGGVTGPALVAWTPTYVGDGSYVYQTITLHTGDDNETYRGRINARESSSSYKSQAKVELRWRAINHNGDNGCDYADGVDNPNDYTVTNSIWLLMSYSSWQDIGTTWESLTGPWEDPPTVDGIELQIRAYGYSSDGSTIKPIAFDNVRGEGT